jgi:hypothetical protein
MVTCLCSLRTLCLMSDPAEVTLTQGGRGLGGEESAALNSDSDSFDSEIFWGALSSLQGDGMEFEYSGSFCHAEPVPSSADSPQAAFGTLAGSSIGQG